MSLNAHAFDLVACSQPVPPATPLQNSRNSDALAGEGITLPQLMNLFHLRLVDAAAALGICSTVLKKRCRLFGIGRWPQRTLASVNASIERLNFKLERAVRGELRSVLQAELAFLQQRRHACYQIGWHQPSRVRHSTRTRRPPAEQVSHQAAHCTTPCLVVSVTGEAGNAQPSTLARITSTGASSSLSGAVVYNALPPSCGGFLNLLADAALLDRGGGRPQSVV